MMCCSSGGGHGFTTLQISQLILTKVFWFVALQIMIKLKTYFQIKLKTNRKEFIVKRIFF